MHTPYTACRRLIVENAARLPREFLHQPDEPSYEGLQEVFWACAAVVVRGLLEAPEWPAAVPVGRARVPLPVPAAAWDGLWAELGLGAPAARAAAATALAADLLGERREPRTGPPLAEAGPPELLGLVLLTHHLNPNRAAPPALGFDPGVLRASARRHPLGDELGAFDEAHVARALAHYVGLRPHRDDALRVAYHAYGRRLAEWLAGRRPAPGPAAASDLLLRALAADEPAAPEWPGLEDQVLGELNRLRAENDALRGLSVSAALGDLLDPLLGGREPPAAAAAQARPDSELARRLLRAAASFFRSPAVALIGTPGERPAGPVPSPEYQLDPAAPPAPPGAPPAYRVSRRGLKLNGTVVLPARVTPATSQPRE